MPVLYGDKILGRIDAKADRAQNVFRVIKFFPEKNARIDGNFKKLFENKLKELAKFSGCDKVIF
jgi:uncharacterized protein YcaQ